MRCRTAVFDLRPSIPVFAGSVAVVRTPLRIDYDPQPRTYEGQGRRGFVLQFRLVDIHPSARKHGIADVDIEHATSNAMVIENQDDDTRLYLVEVPKAATRRLT